MRGVRFKSPRLRRATLAALLSLALLSGAIPLATLSAAHSCSMPCCAEGVGGCSTGACSGGALSKPPEKTEEEKLCGTQAAHDSHGAQKGGRPVEASKKSEHCHTDAVESETANADSNAKPPEASSMGEAEGAANAISSGALASPCPRDCCAGLGSFAQTRRGRDSAALASPYGALKHVSLPPSLYSENLSPITSPYLKRLRARAPPASSRA